MLWLKTLNMHLAEWKTKTFPIWENTLFSLVFQGGPFEAIKKAKKSEFAYAIGCSPPALSSPIKSSASAPICWFMTSSLSCAYSTYFLTTFIRNSVLRLSIMNLMASSTSVCDLIRSIEEA